MGKPKLWSQLPLYLVALTLLVTNVFLIFQNRQLRQSLEESKQFVTERGYTFTNLKLKDLDGIEETINLSDSKHKTILLIFRSNCDYCVQQYPYWKGLVENLDPNLWRVIAITSEKKYDVIKTHLKENQLDNIKAVSVADEDLRKARMLFTPQTIVIGIDGQVEQVRAGLWKSKNLSDY